MKIDPKEIHDMIQKSRPNLKENTIKQYETNLRKLKKIFETDNFDFLSSPDKVKDKIKMHLSWAKWAKKHGLWEDDKMEVSGNKVNYNN